MWHVGRGRARSLLVRGSSPCGIRDYADAQRALGGDEGEARVVPVRERRSEPRGRTLRQALEHAARQQLGPAVLDRRQDVLCGPGSLEERPVVCRLGGSGARRERGDDARGVKRRRPPGSGRGGSLRGVSRRSGHQPIRPQGQGVDAGTYRAGAPNRNKPIGVARALRSAVLALCVCSMYENSTVPSGSDLPDHVSRYIFVYLYCKHVPTHHQNEPSSAPSATPNVSACLTRLLRSKLFGACAAAPYAFPLS